MQMDEGSRKAVEEAERQLGHATGIGLISRGECPVHAFLAIACTFCPYGHALDCHYPKTCEEANCGHYKEQLDVEESTFSQER